MKIKTIFSRLILKTTMACPRLFNDRAYLKILFRCIMEKPLDLDTPLTFNEKLQWLKLYNRDPEYKNLVDKYEVRKYVSERIGEEYLIPLIGVYDGFDEIDIESLPNEFVIKCTHDSGSVVIVKDKSQADWKAIKKKICKALKKNQYLKCREWVYKGLKPRIIIEQRIKEDSNGKLKDYKFFCFDGEPQFSFVATDRDLGNKGLKFDYFDADFKLLPVRQVSHPSSGIQQDKPINYDMMLDISRKLSKGFPHVRIDLYNLGGRIYFGEYTFYHHGGLVKFVPEEYDRIFGDMLPLPKIDKRKNKDEKKDK